jgi:hypothetical protein
MEKWIANTSLYNDGIGRTISAKTNLLSFCFPRHPLTVKLLMDMISTSFIWMGIEEERQIVIVFMVAFLDKLMHIVI